MRPARVFPVLFVIGVAMIGCTKDQALARTATALDAVQASTDVAWSLAVESSLREQNDYLDGLERIKEASPLGVEALPPRTEVEAHIAEIRARWAPRFLGFRAVRIAHAAALQAYEAYVRGDGALDVLLAALTEVLSAYTELQSILGAVPGLDFDLPSVDLGGSE